MSNIKKLRKGNRVIEVNQSQVKGYLQRGYDEINEVGEVVTAATGGKTVSLAEYNKVKAQLKEALQNGSAKEVADLEQRIKDLLNDIKALEEENARLDGLLKRNQNRQKQ